MSPASSPALNPLQDEVDRLQVSNAEIGARLEVAEETLRAIRSGEVDALVVQGQTGTQIFTLRGAEAEYNQFRGDILSQISDSVVAVDLDQHVTYLNAAAEKQYGITASEALGRRLSELWTVQWLNSEAEEAAAAALRDIGRWRGESIHIKHSGEKIYVESAVIRLHDVHGNIIGLLATIRDVTDRKRTEERVQNIAQQLRLIADTAPVLIAHCDRDSRYKFVNEPYARQFGLRREEIIGRQIADVIGAAACESLQPYIDSVLAGETVEFDTVHPRQEGEPYYMRCAYAPERNAAGEVIGLVAAIIDITDRRRAEDRLVEQSRLLDLSFDAIFVRDAENRITYWSKGAEDAYGFSREEALGRVKEDLLRTEFPEPLERIMEQLNRDGRWVGEVKHIRKDGAVIMDNTRWVLDRDAQGRPASILETNTDVTERRRAEGALRASEEKYRSLIQSLPAAVYTCDREGYIQLYNAAAVELWGREPEIGKDLWCGSYQLYRADGSPLELIHCPMARTLQEGRAVRGEEIIVERADGTRRHVLPYPDPIFDDEGRMTGAVNMLLDVTERKRTEMLLRDAKDAAELASKSKDRFLAVLSHELRTPLTPVLLAVAAMEHDAALQPEMREELMMIKRNIELETKLIDDLLDLSRITSGKLALDIEAVDLNDTVRQVCSICAPQLRERAVFLEVELDDEAGMVAADSARLQQVLWNVLKNAIKFTPEKGVIQVSTARRDDGYCEVRVIDPGIGIPADRLPHVFNAFEQGGSNITRQFGGLGLGLAICKALMELHHGSIRAESAGVGQGATFIIELPSKTMTTTAKIRLAAPPVNAVLPQLRLLLVEDHADTARILSRQLCKAGVTVLQAADVNSAIKLAEHESFDLLVSDLGLPDGSGYDVMRRVRAARGMPGIAMSGYGMEEDMRRSREAGFSEHLVKPIDLRELIAAIRRVVKEHRR
ncbi:PAS domain S-box protein [Prosthecobacter sp.]|uniref:PAS domain S-box protein n=1 Tax=Prosthecobacter sp. TaxID=1965333 RepID=UPI003784E0F4